MYSKLWCVIAGVTVWLICAGKDDAAAKAAKAKTAALHARAQSL
jgi:hypothetical protein